MYAVVNGCLWCFYGLETPSAADTFDALFLTGLDLLQERQLQVYAVGACLVFDVLCLL